MPRRRAKRSIAVSAAAGVFCSGAGENDLKRGKGLLCFALFPGDRYESGVDITLDLFGICSLELLVVDDACF